MKWIYWDIEKEKQKNREYADKILKKFSDVEGLKDVLDSVLNLMDSEIYEKVYEASNLGEKIGDFAPPSAEYLLNRYRQNKYSSTILKNPTLNLFTDNIIFSHYLATTGMIGFINHAYKGHKLSLNDLDKQHIILERIMSQLDDFDKLEDYQSPDEEFYQKQKNIKWKKEGKSLFEEIHKIRRDIKVVRWGTKSTTFSNGENYYLIFLTACSAVKHQRNEIVAEDVVVAYKTYLKLLNTDISKLV